jgi:uridine phosphorylase
MPRHLNLTAPIAIDTILVGDPGRALLLAQELLEEPKMSNHARGLWGYSGSTPAGKPLTIQATGIGGPSAALVLGELAELGTRRAIRIGTCTGFDDDWRLGELLSVSEAIAAGGSAAAYGVGPGKLVLPDAPLSQRLLTEAGETARAARIASFDGAPSEHLPPRGAVAGDMQTVALLARARELGIEAAALLIVAETNAGSEHLAKEALEEAEKQAGRIAAATL